MSDELSPAKVRLAEWVSATKIVSDGVMADDGWPKLTNPAREHERNRRRLWDMMNGPVLHTDMKDAIEQAVKAERHACSIAVWMTLQDALADDADDKGLDGWMREAEARIKARA